MKRPFELMVDSGNEDEPRPRRFASLESALAAFDQLDPQWRGFAWIREYHPISRAYEIAGRVVVHMRDGVRA